MDQCFPSCSVQTQIIPAVERKKKLDHGVQVECFSRSFSTQLVKLDEDQDTDKAKNGFLLKCHLYTLKVPRVGGGSTLSVKVSWFQKLSYQDNQFCLNIPFSFQPYVTPVERTMPKIERIHLNVNSGIGSQILCKSTSQVLKVSSSDIFGSVLLQSPPLHDFDQREMFCLYLDPGNGNNTKCLKKEVIFLVDINASMRGYPLDHTKAALLAALSKLNPEDTFNIIAFNGDSSLFSSSLQLATKDAIENANEWISSNVIADGGTNISLSLSQELNTMSKTRNLISLIFLITDWSVEDEKDICAVMKHQLVEGGLNSPRVCIFGIGGWKAILETSCF